ncbi:MAG TPA: hypothetical protein PLS49_02160 [Candidatus Woesebacteria bacterium]|nr:hypothetical protein [Candidatus Woesebacteria bacterium]
MKLSHFRYIESSKYIRLSVEITSPSLKKPFTLWLEADRKDKALLHIGPEVFLPSVLLLAMRYKEDFVINEPIRKDVLTSLYNVMDLVSTWEQTSIWTQLHKIQIRPISTVSCTNTRNKKKSAAFFSLGLDSFYALYHDVVNKNKLSYLILVHGFDIALENQKLFETVYQNAEVIAKETKKKIIVVRTNLKEFTGLGITWDAAHGAGLASVGYLFAGGLDTVLINSGDTRSTKVPYGTRFDLDKL